MGITSIFVTHDQDEAVEVADEIIVTNQGRIEQIADPFEIYKNPATPFVAEFIGQSARMDGYHKLKDLKRVILKVQLYGRSLWKHLKVTI